MIHWHDRLASTMNEGHRLAEAGAEHGTAVAARVQTEGRGRRGSRWASPEGGLWLSVVCRPPAASAVETLSVRAGEAIADALQRRLPDLPPITVKLPNDLLVGGRKLAGILCEARWEGTTPLWVVIGVGLNVANPIPESLRTVAVTLAELGISSSPEVLAETVAQAIAAAGGQGDPGA